MKRKGGALLWTAVSGLILSLLLAAGSQLLSPPLKQEAGKIRDNLEQVEAFIAEPWGTAFQNMAAQEDFSQSWPQEEGPEDAVASYLSPEGIQFFSMSQAWDQEKLEELYQELLRNKHGEELYSLRSVLVYPQPEDFAAATHQSLVRENVLYLDFPALPENFSFSFQCTEGVITLYDGDRNTTPASMASNLSHEYGHHFTFYHMFGEEEEEQLQSRYAQLRDLAPGQALVDRTDLAGYQENHQWYLVEMAAEDYVMLMGSPNAMAVGEYRDVRDYLEGQQTEETQLLRNAMPQENMMLPVAWEVEGLADYFYSFVSEPPPDPLPQKDFTLSITENKKGYDLVTGYQEFTSYQLKWDKVYGEDATYTLISYQPEDYNNSFYPIKTVSPGEEAGAWIGCVTQEESYSISYLDDELARGTRTFQVTALLPDGRVAVSQPLVYTF